MEHLLNELTEVYDLGRAQYEISAMLCSLALDRPHSVLDFLIERGRREEAMWRREVWDFSQEQSDAVPYNGFAGLQEALQKSAEYESIFDHF